MKDVVMKDFLNEENKLSGEGLALLERIMKAIKMKAVPAVYLRGIIAMLTDMKTELVREELYEAVDDFKRMEEKYDLDIEVSV